MSAVSDWHIIRVKSRRTAALERHHPWVFSGALVEEDLEGIEAGDLVELRSNTGEFLARGYYEDANIAVYLLTFDRIEVDEKFWSQRLRSALALRTQLGLTTAPDSAYCLVNAEGDDLPGLVVDVYGDLAIVQAYTLGMHRLRGELFAALHAVLGDRLTAIYYKPEPESIRKYEGVIDGSITAVNECFASEDSRLFHLNLSLGQRHGFPLDQRDNHRLVQELAGGRSVLSTFAYSGGFSLAALKGGATKVTSVESSGRALSLLERNIELNFSDVGAIQHESIQTDEFGYLKQVPLGHYDMIVLDPPAFASRKGMVRNALQGYRKLNTDALRALSPGGLLFTFSYSPVVTTEQFRQSVFHAALQAQREVKVLSTLTQAKDHPVSIYHPEGEYLKGLLLYVS
ncbi:MAG: class I SAM-dependent rRNA methyltransferase [Porphyromonas sp.]|nr:class I SAM-dependent rRNA methyltransferase [Porphyromonas sp.]